MSKLKHGYQEDRVRLLNAGIRNPQKIPRYLMDNVRDSIKWGFYDMKYSKYRRKNGIPLQKDRVYDLLEQEEFVLVILDSCRFDYFEGLYDGYFTGELEKIWSAGNRTKKWTPELWDSEFDVDYVSAIIHPVSKANWVDRPEDFDPEKTFRNTINITSNLYTKYPTAEKVTDTTIAHLRQAQDIRCVVHYAQPHRPYLGETKILPWRATSKSLKKVMPQDQYSEVSHLETSDGYLFGEDILSLGLTEGEIDQLDKAQYESRTRIKNGELSDYKLRVAYEDNLHYVLQNVRKLVEFIDVPVVISADHGEHLGEYTYELPRYHHPNQTHPILREVPWFVVDERHLGKRKLASASVDEAIHKSDYETSEEDVEEQLKALGYK